MEIHRGERRGVFKITAELLHTVLRLPANSKVTGFSPYVYWEQDAYAIRVVCDDLPEVTPGHAATELDPQYRTGGDGQPEFMGWGLPNTATPTAPPSMDTPQRMVMEAMQGYRVADAMRKLASITEQCVADGTYGDTDTPAVVEN